jgi:hypothetical protein
MYFLIDFYYIKEDFVNFSYFLFYKSIIHHILQSFTTIFLLFFLSQFTDTQAYPISYYCLTILLFNLGSFIYV